MSLSFLDHEIGSDFVNLGIEEGDLKMKSPQEVQRTCSPTMIINIVQYI